MDGYLIAIDQGTTSTRVFLFNSLCQIVSQHQINLQQHFPANGWVEHNPEDIWRDTLTACRQVLANAKISAREVLTIGIANQRETTIIWDRKTGVPIYPAIVWQDRRTFELCEKLQTKEKIITAKTGLVLDPYFSATKIAWILNQVPDARQRAENGELAFGTIDTFLLWRLTAGKMHATDATNAARTSLFNIVSQKWDAELLKIFDIPSQILPEVKDNSADFGITSSEWFGTSIPISAMAGDQQAALIGQTCFAAGMLKATYGTGGFLLLNTGSELVHSRSRLLSTIAYRLKNKVTYALEGSFFAAGTIIKWLRDQLKLITTAAESEIVAKQVQDNDGVYLIPAFTGLGAPYWNPKARAALLGLNYNTQNAHIVRAGLEAIAYQTRDLIQAMVEDGAVQPEILKIDGGIAANNWLLQFLADILSLTIERSKNIESTALGVAFLAGLQLRLYNSLDDLIQLRQIDRVFTPQMNNKQREKYYHGWQDALNMVIKS